MRTIHELLRETADAFVSCGWMEPRREAETLLCELLHCSRSFLYLNREQFLTVQEWQRCRSWIERRLRGEPLAYLSGRIEFYGCTLAVTPAVLVPRPETELLVDKIVNSLKKESLQGRVLWDLCCGSGCIGIALKKAFPSLAVYLSDLSVEAVALAAQNAAANGVAVTVLHGDLFTPFLGMKAHYVVCNPPYISEEEYATLDRGVKDYEPRLALVGGNSGLELYERLACDLSRHLHPKAKVWLEIGYRQGETVPSLFRTIHWRKRELSHDWAGHPRFFLLENE